MQELIWLSFAYVAGLAATYCGLPVFVGYLLAGFGLGLAGQEPNALLEHASHLGVLLLLFSVGLHVNPRVLLSREVYLGGSMHLLISTGLFLLTCAAFGLGLEMGVFLGLLLSMSSTVIAAKDLEARNELGAYHGRVAIGILILQDIMAVILLSTIGEQAPPLYALLVLPALLILRPALLWLLSISRSDDLVLLLGTLLALGVAHVFEIFHLSGELGAMLAGALFASGHRGEQLGQRTWALKEIFLVGFFLKVGMIAQPDAESLTWALLILAVLPFKTALFFSLLVLLGMRARTAFITGTTLTSYSEFTLVGGLAGYQSGLLSADYLSVLALATALSFAINLPVNRLVSEIYSRVSEILVRLGLQGSTPAATGTNPEQQYLVLGMGRTGQGAYRYLDDLHFPVCGVDIDPDLVEQSREEGRRILCADARDPDFWQQSAFQGLQGLVICLPQAEARMDVVQLIREAGIQAKISAFALHVSEVDELRELGADEVSHLLDDAGARLAQLSLK